MKRLRRCTGIILAAIGIISLSATNIRIIGAQNEKVLIEKTMDGQLLNVDKNARLISVRGPDQKEAMFNYSDDIRVISPDKTMQGLVGKSGAEVRIRYREDRGVKLAISIELIEKH